MALRKRGMIWHVYFRDLDGRITSQSLRVTDREDAERLDRGEQEIPALDLARRKTI